MNDTLATMKDRLQDMKEQGTFDFPLIIDALRVLLDAAISAQPKGPGAPTTSAPAQEGTSDD